MTTWKSIPDKKKKLIKIGLKCILSNGQRISYWHDIWLNDYPLIEKVTSENLNEINQAAKVGDFINEEKIGS